MQAYNFIFDATQYDPQQSSPTHPIGIFLAEVVNTDIKPTKDGTSGFFEVTFRTEAGRIVNRYNLWNANEVAARTAHNQLSALSYVTGNLRLDMGNKGVELRGGRCSIEVTKQANTEYTQVSRVMDANGNEPMAQGVRPPQQGNQAPQGQPTNGLGLSQAMPPQAWSKPADAAAQAPGQASAPWQQQAPASTPNASNAPPWASR